MEKKKTQRILRIMFFVMGLGFFFGYGGVFAAEEVKYPERNITCIVPGRPGGGADIIARTSASYLKKYLPKQTTVVVQNIDAAGGRVGAFQVYDAKPDGYTFGVGDSMVFILANALGEFGKRDISRITWLCRVSSQPYAMGLSHQSPIKKVEDLKGRKVFAAVSQFTLATTVSMLRFLGANPEVIMYGGGADCCLAAIRGDVDVVIQVDATVLRQAESSGGRLIPLTVFAENRLPTAPNLPTIKELGFNVPESLTLLMSYDYVIYAPYGIPSGVHKVMYDAIEKTLHDPGFTEDLKRAKLTVNTLPSDEVQKRVSRMVAIMPQYVEVMRQALGK